MTEKDLPSTHQWVCPNCKRGDRIFDISAMQVRYGPMTFDEGGVPEDESFNRYKDLMDSIDFLFYVCEHCTAEFHVPVKLNPVSPDKPQCP